MILTRPGDKETVEEFILDALKEGNPNAVLEM